MIQIEGYTIETRGKQSGQIKTKCPKCRELGKKHLNTDLSVNLDSGVFKCHKCGWEGRFKENINDVIRNIEKTYDKPKTENLTELSDEHLAYFKTRGISSGTLRRCKVKSGKGDWFIFQYLEDGEVVNLKGRGSKEKKFYQAANAKPIMYKLDDIKDQKEIIICEGEFDALSFEEIGKLNATSVNQGAPNANDKNVDKKLECITNCFDIFEEATTIILAVDMDENGQRLSRELVKRFGAEKCKTVDFKDCKDANEVLVKHGKQALRECLNEAKDVPVEGVCFANDYLDQVLDLYRNGQTKGTTTYFENIDKHWTWRTSEVNIWTGYNNEGKSMMLKQLMLIKSKFEGWKHAIFCPEETPMKEFITDLIESYTGLSADKDKENYMNEMQLLDGLKFVHEHFIIIDPEEHTLSEILKKASYLIRKFRCKTLMLDPYNQIEHRMKAGEREDLYISRFMAKLKKFANDQDISLNLVAHQVTPDVTVDRETKEKKDYAEPNLYKIKGGGTFADKADNIISIWRPHRNTNIHDTSVKFIAQKIKKQKLTGLPGETELSFNRSTNRYYMGSLSPFDIDEDKQSELDNNGFEQVQPYDFSAGFDEEIAPF